MFQIQLVPTLSELCPPFVRPNYPNITFTNYLQLDIAEIPEEMSLFEKI